MDIGRAFSYVFQDQRWLSKVAIGGLVSAVPILNFAAFGYMLKVAQNVAQDNPQPLPEWNDFGDHFMRGLYAVVITIVYLIPYFIIIGIFSCITGMLGGASSGSDSASAAAGLLGCLFVPIYLIVLFASLLLSYAAMARYAATNTLGEAFKFGEIFAMVRNHPGPWLMFLLVALLAGIVGGLGIIACGIGVIFTAFYSYLVMGHALGQTMVQQGMVGGSMYNTPPPSYEPPTTSY
ncbi:MAG TPA: DUF4013 domain-containing protein [Roseiflexaceae bacterium]|jgi:uncharacterized RDD family membrane protein YckC|nr:DUF4013 domain-containing protein [Roseiflexaceae bacterium]